MDVFRVKMAKRTVIIGSVIAAAVVLAGLGVLIWWLITREADDSTDIKEPFIVRRKYVLIPVKQRRRRPHNSNMSLLQN